MQENDSREHAPKESAEDWDERIPVESPTEKDTEETQSAAASSVGMTAPSMARHLRCTMQLAIQGTWARCEIRPDAHGWDVRCARCKYAL